MGETYYIQKEQDKGDIDHLILQEMKADLCESWHGKKQDNESWWSKQREKLQAEYLNMTKKGNSAAQKCATYLQVKVIQAWFETKILSFKSLPGHPKKNPLKCSCQTIRKFVGVLLYPLRSVLHLPFSMKHFQASITPGIILRCAQSYLSAHNQTPKLVLTEGAIAHPGQHLLSKQIEIL